MIQATDRCPVAVVGAGVRTPAGDTLDALWAGLCDGSSTAAPFVDDHLGVGVAVLGCRAQTGDLDPYLSVQERRRLGRIQHLAIPAAEDALNAGGGPGPLPSERCAVVAGTGFGAVDVHADEHAQLLERGLRGVRPPAVPVIMPNATAALLAMRFGFRGPCHTVVAACASGAVAIGEAAELLRRGAADIVLAGGADAMLHYSVVAGFLRIDAMSRNLEHPELASRPFDVDRDGFVLGEGAGFVLMERASDAAREGREVLGIVHGYGNCSDAHHLVAPAPSGEGALRSMRLALDDAGIAATDLNHVNAHGTSTVLNDASEAAALSNLFEDSTMRPLTAPKGTTGHMIGASGAVEAIVTLLSLRHGMVPPVAGLRTVDPALPVDPVVGAPRPIGPGYGLSNSFGFGGVNASLVLGRA
jgi:3-oxoacyl-[acyl-carrier-protein] synthase II